MGTYDATWNPWGSFSQLANPYAFMSDPLALAYGVQGSRNACPAHGGDPFSAYRDQALAMAVGRFFSGSGAGNDFGVRPELELGLRMMMQQLNQGSAINTAQGAQNAQAMQLQQNMQQLGELVVMMALCMMVADRMQNGGGRDFGGQFGNGVWGSGSRVNGGWPTTGTEWEKGGGVNGPTGTIRGGSASGQHLAQVAERTAMGMGSVGMCYRGAKASIARATGVQLTGGSAWMAANQLANSGRFREVSVPQSQLRNLPAGAVVVWGQTNRSPHGHISVALGDGREASDHVQRQITSLRGASNYRVFVPNDMATSGGQIAGNNNLGGAVPAGNGQAYSARGTGYYPFNNAMEGGYFDRQGARLNTLEDYLAGRAPYVSVAMDSRAFPYGTRMRIPELERKYGRPIEFRVVDTGGAFRGRGTSRIDICTANRERSLDPTVNGPLTLIV